MVSQRTERIRLGIGVVLAPIHHPLHVAQRMATLEPPAERRPHAIPAPAGGRRAMTAWGAGRKLCSRSAASGFAP